MSTALSPHSHPLCPPGRIRHTSQRGPLRLGRFLLLTHVRVLMPTGGRAVPILRRPTMDDNVVINQSVTINRMQGFPGSPQAVRLLPPHSRQNPHAHWRGGCAHPPTTCNGSQCCHQSVTIDTMQDFLGLKHGGFFLLTRVRVLMPTGGGAAHILRQPAMDHNSVTDQAAIGRQNQISMCKPC